MRTVPGAPPTYEEMAMKSTVSGKLNRAAQIGKKYQAALAVP